MNKRNIAVIASRLKCVDAISIESDKWIDKYVKLGYNVHLIAGKFGEPVHIPNLELPVMDYKHPEIRGIKRIVFGADLDKQGKKAAEILTTNMVKRIKGPLKEYLVKNNIQILSVEDALSSMKNLPLNIALSQIVNELGLPTISRYHYLPWDNPYFTRYDNLSKITSSIPAKTKTIVHVTNTASAMQKLGEKKQIVSKIIPNTVDMDKIQAPDDFNKDFRKELGIRDDQLIFLQPTRVKRNKYVERSIKIVAEINDIMKKDNVLLITGSPVYSRGNYFEEIVKKMNKQGVKVIFANDRVFLGRHKNPEQKFYSIHDAYLHADVVLYPNAGDAFGNPILEAAAYKKPIIVNNFPNLEEFKSRGFQFVMMDNKVDNEVVSDTYELIANSEKAKKLAEHNFTLLKKHYSSDALDDSLMPILRAFDNEQSFMSKVAGLIPKRLWPKGEPVQDKKKKFKGAKPRPNNKANKKGKGKKYKNPDLKNKKGGYKEPVKR